jgi:uncharacterized protein (TIGR03790 family)
LWLGLSGLGLLPALAAAALGASQLAVVVNDADPLSVKVGAYYQQARHIPAGQLIHVRFAGQRPALSASEFAPIRAAILAATPAHVQAYALTWAQPYRVDCMSITSALTFGFDPAWCTQGKGCRQTRASPLYDYDSAAPFTDLGIRPSMMIAATGFTDARALIDRGVSADHTHPRGGAYLLVTSDRQRSSRVDEFVRASTLRVPGLAMHLLRGNLLPRRLDVLFYFTGLPVVKGLEALDFLPGAVGDHLTSFGGMLTDSPQMSALRWLEAGATGSYGTVQEPCSYPQKFPNPAVLIRRYTQGETLIEAYWKSVSSPGEGVFVGEPLANPWH